jgi:hypothetical protein
MRTLRTPKEKHKVLDLPREQKDHDKVVAELETMVKRTNRRGLDVCEFTTI